jgi:hypothetical protein
MTITEEVAAGVSQALAPIAENLINSLGKMIGADKDRPLLGNLSGKKIVIEITIPDLTKPNG